MLISPVIHYPPDGLIAHYGRAFSCFEIDRTIYPTDEGLINQVNQISMYIVRRGAEAGRPVNKIRGRESV